MLFPGKNADEAALYKAAWKKSLPYVIAAELILIAVLIPVFLLFRSGDAAESEEYNPIKAPPVEWPEPEAFLQEGAGPNRFTDLPWEVSDGRGAVLVPDVFYADDFQNEQIMPTALPLKLGSEGRPYAYQVDRLIYPTIGNPALLVRADRDAMRVVLRLKGPDFAFLGPEFQPAAVSHAPHLQEVSFEKQDDRNRILLYLLNREQRGITESSRPAPANAAAGIELQPTAVYLHDRETVPGPLRGRDTFQFVFEPAAFEKFKPGLYDLRLEIFKQGRLKRHEFQYNAVRIFDAVPEKYTILNVTDSQASLSELLDGVPNEVSFKSISMDKLQRFVAYAKAGRDDMVKNAAFITFNGDLHNGGSPGTLLPEAVAKTYNDEAVRILEILRELPVPIFLTPGNHDGYVSMGHVPAPIRLKLSGLAFLGGLFGAEKSLRTVVEENAGEEAWDGFARYLERTSGQPGGWHRDVFTGRFVRRGRTDGGLALSWQLVPDNARNHVLYDGFYQWRRAYGPLFYSFRFGRNHFAVLNTYDLRQHRRSGWGMYTVNYGGGISPFQMNWLRRDIRANEAAGRDITLIAHHDPRGGHNGEDYPYYFEMIEYTGMGESAVNYVKGEILNPLLCGNQPKWSQSKSDALSCMHDGLQEWMRADPDFDCADQDLFEEGPRTGFCDSDRFKSKTFAGNPRRPEYSGYQLLHRLVRHRAIRTMLLGHTHYNSLEILQPGDEIVPGRVVLDLTADKRYAKIEVENPLRKHAHEDLDRVEALEDARAEERQKAVAGATETSPAGERQGELEKIKIIEKDGVPLRVLDLEKSGHNFQRRLSAKELAILRMTSIADLSLQQFQGRPLHGFSVFEVYAQRDRRGYRLPQINRVHYYQADGGAVGADSESTAFQKVGSVDLERTKRWKRRGENPLLKLFKLPGTKSNTENEPDEAGAPDR